MAIPAMSKRLQDDICLCEECLERAPWKVEFKDQVLASVRRGRYLMSSAQAALIAKHGWDGEE